MTDIEQVIVRSPFLDTIRDLRFNDIEYSDLLSALESLAGEWERKEFVNKEVACELFILPSTVRGSAHRLANSPIGDRMNDAADELEAVILQCLGCA